MNQPIRHGGWYPDWQLRFFNRHCGHWKNVLIHESVEMNADAKIEKLSGDILHYSVDDAAHHHRMIGTRYAPLAAEQMLRRGKTSSKLKIFTVGMTTFLQTYVLKAGFLDGLPGFCIARFAAHHAFLKHLLLWEMRNNSQSAVVRRESKKANPKL
jgi:(heptosyl)LPS beta-1,4-glucosyltransferase